MNEWIVSTLKATTLSQWMIQLSWLWPLCETLHFIGLTLLVGIVGLLDLRLLGFLRRLPLAAVQRLIPWAIAGFVINLITGVLFFVGAPDQYITNVAWWFKVLFLAVAGANMLFFETTQKARALRVGGRRHAGDVQGHRRGLASVVVHGLVLGPNAALHWHGVLGHAVIREAHHAVLRLFGVPGRRLHHRHPARGRNERNPACAGHGRGNVLSLDRRGACRGPRRRAGRSGRTRAIPLSFKTDSETRSQVWRTGPDRHSIDRSMRHPRSLHAGAAALCVRARRRLPSRGPGSLDAAHIARARVAGGSHRRADLSPGVRHLS